jgi:tripartite-type tricarboxylate transporter receptor subunit TctC
MSNLRYQISRLAQIIIASSVIFSSSIIAQDFPTKPVRIFGQGPGSTADYLSRLLGQKLTEKWGQPVLIDSRAGAGGTVPADIVAKAPADGYTLLMGHAGPNVSAVVLYPNLPYDPVKDLAGVSMVAIGVTVMMVHPSISAGTVTEFIQYAKKRNDLNFSSAGNGSISHLGGELFKQVSGINMMHIPYKSAGAGLTALLANETQVSFLSPVTAAAQLKSGKLKALVVSTQERFPGMPDVPGAAEAGLAGMDAKLWFGLFTPSKTPKAVIQKLNSDITEILRRPEVVEMVLNQGIQAIPSSPESLDDFVKSEIKRWTPIIKNANIQAN